MLADLAIPDTMFAKIVLVLDKPDDWRDWWVYMKDLALHRNIWKYTDPDDETITKEKPVEPTLPVPAKASIDMDETEQFVWQLESEHVIDWSAQGARRPDSCLDCYLDHRWPEHRFVFRRYASERQLLIKLRDRIAALESW
ncbi:hypothetical protein GB937_001460 [Aspergillus fischeri]|nr:hypothetical protein GB937_001460 [Aspergillus fischeri]